MLRGELIITANNLNFRGKDPGLNWKFWYPCARASVFRLKDLLDFRKMFSVKARKVLLKSHFKNFFLRASLNSFPRF